MTRQYHDDRPITSRAEALAYLTTAPTTVYKGTSRGRYTLANLGAGAGAATGFPDQFLISLARRVQAEDRVRMFPGRPENDTTPNE